MAFITSNGTGLEALKDERSGQHLVASMGRADSSHEKRPLKRARPPPKSSAGESERVEPAPDTTSSPPQPPRLTRCSDEDRHVKCGEPRLPWLPDRFYINELPCLREGGHEDSGRERRRSGPNVFSLKRLLEVVTGDGWPGLKGVILGTFSLDMSFRARVGTISGGRRLAEECPALMATPALILHGDRSLRRANRNDQPGNSGSPRPSAGREVEASRSDGRDGGEGICLVQAGISGDVSPERRRSMEQAGRRDRILGWKMQLPTEVEVVKVEAGRRGVHHPKYGLLFLKDGSLVMYVGTGNFGSDTAIDATWVQRFGAKSANETTVQLSSQAKEERRRRLSGNERREVGSGGDDDGLKSGGFADGEGVWQGDFAETLQDFLEQESRLILRRLKTKRARPTTPVEFMHRVVGVTHVGESFDFSKASVDLIPTVPTEIPGEEDELGRSRLTMPLPLPLPCQDRGRRYACDAEGDRFCGHENGGGGGNGDYPRRQHYYGQLRMRYVLGRRRREAGELGPSDSLIVQPTSLGTGIDHAFMEVFAANCMPDSIEPCGGAWREHFESRLESCRIVWPSAQYMDACRSDMSKSPCLSDRQVATVMEVSRQYVLGESGKDPNEINCPFLFMTPQILESMGVDLRDCLRTFHLHSALGLPLRPAHVKSAMRLRPPPPLMTLPLEETRRRRVRDKGEGSSKEYGGISESSGGGSRGVRRVEVSRSLVGEGRGPCEHAQHLAWFLLTSASLSQGAQGVVTHAPVTGVPTGVNCKNVELGVLFHSTPTRAYYVEPVLGCGCGEGCGSSDPDLEARVSTAASGTAVERTGEKGDAPRWRVHVPLPVPFRLDSEPYSNPEAGSPDLRFLPYMHLLKEFPRPAHIESLLKSDIKEAQFA